MAKVPSRDRLLVCACADLVYHRVTPSCVLTISYAAVFVPAFLLTRTLLPFLRPPLGIMPAATS